MCIWDKGEAVFYCKSSCPHSQIGSFYVNEVPKLCSFDWTGQVSVCWQGFSVVVDSDGIKKHSIEQEAKVLSSIRSTWEAHQQMAARLLLLIKFGPSIDHRVSISADKFLPWVHIKWIFRPQSPAYPLPKLNLPSLLFQG